MAEIINIPDFGEVRLSLKEYNEMRDRIKDLEEQNDTLTEMLDNVCDENKVRVRRQIIKVTELTTNPRALGMHYIGFELSPDYCDIIRRRLEQTKTLFDSNN